MPTFSRIFLQPRAYKKFVLNGRDSLSCILFDLSIYLALLLMKTMQLNFFVDYFNNIYEVMVTGKNMSFSWALLLNKFSSNCYMNLQGAKQWTLTGLPLMDPIGLNMEKAMATHSSLLAWRTPGKSLVSYSPWGCRVGHNWVTNTHTHKHTGLKKMHQRTGKEKAPVNEYKVNMAWLLFPLYLRLETIETIVTPV